MGTEEATEKSPRCDFVTVDIKIHLKHKNLPILNVFSHDINVKFPKMHYFQVTGKRRG